MAQGEIPRSSPLNIGRIGRVPLTITTNASSAVARTVKVTSASRAPEAPGFGVSTTVAGVSTLPLAARRISAWSTETNGALETWTFTSTMPPRAPGDAADAHPVGGHPHEGAVREDDVALLADRAHEVFRT